MTVTEPSSGWTDRPAKTMVPLGVGEENGPFSSGNLHWEWPLTLDLPGWTVTIYLQARPVLGHLCRAGGRGLLLRMGGGMAVGCLL